MAAEVGSGASATDSVGGNCISAAGDALVESEVGSGVDAGNSEEVAPSEEVAGVNGSCDETTKKAAIANAATMTCIDEHFAVLELVLELID